MFLLHLETNLVAIRSELCDGGYTPGAYRSFLIHDPKTRIISAAPFRDRVVHHALTRVLEPIFERRFTSRSFASRRGFGTHRALAIARHASRRFRFVLKCDIRKYFPSIDHQILKDQLRRAVKCQPTLNLAATIIDASNPQEDVFEYFRGDTLFTPFERRKGLPLGNQTSQFFANVYLNGFDHFVLRELQPGEYVRYVDDFLLFGDSKQELRRMREQITAFLEKLRLTLHPGKSRIHRTADGVTFLGWRIFPARLRVARANVVRMRRRLRSIMADWESGRISRKKVRARLVSWIGHVRHGNTWRLRRELFRHFTIKRRGGPPG